MTLTDLFRTFQQQLLPVHPSRPRLFLLSVSAAGTAYDALSAARAHHQAQPLTDEVGVRYSGADELCLLNVFPANHTADLLGLGLTLDGVVALLTDDPQADGADRQRLLRAEPNDRQLLDTQGSLSAPDVDGVGAMFLHGGYWHLIGPARPR